MTYEAFEGVDVRSFESYAEGRKERDSQGFRSVGRPPSYYTRTCVEKKNLPLWNAIQEKKPKEHFPLRKKSFSLAVILLSAIASF